MQAGLAGEQQQRHLLREELKEWQKVELCDAVDQGAVDDALKRLFSSPEGEKGRNQPPPGIPEAESAPAGAVQPVVLGEGDGEGAEVRAFESSVQLYRLQKAAPPAGASGLTTPPRWRLVCGKAYPAVLRLNDDPGTGRSRVLVRSGHKLFVNSLITTATPSPRLLRTPEGGPGGGSSSSTSRLLVHGTMQGRRDPEPILLDMERVGEAAARELLRLLKARIDQAPEVPAESSPASLEEVGGWEVCRRTVGRDHDTVLPVSIAFSGDGVCAGPSHPARLGAGWPWLRTFLIGTEWAAYRGVHERGWEFGPALAEGIPALLRSGIPSSSSGGSSRGGGGEDRIYLWGQTEPCFLGAGTPAAEVLLVPVLIAVRSSTASPPPSVLGLTSVQMASESLVPMGSVGVAWREWDTAGGEGSTCPGLMDRVSYLHCDKTWQEVDAMSQREALKWSYMVPYIQPTTTTTATTTSGAVGEPCPAEEAIGEWHDPHTGRTVSLHYHSDLYDSPAGYAEEVVEEEDWLLGHGASARRQIEAWIVAKLKEPTPAAAPGEGAARVSREVTRALEGAGHLAQMTVYKLYPSNPGLGLRGLRQAFVNRFYGHATAVL